jgi:hypothetical protein
MGPLLNFTFPFQEIPVLEKRQIWPAAHQKEEEEEEEEEETSGIPSSALELADHNQHFSFFYCCTVHFDNIKILFTNKCTLY